MYSCTIVTTNNHGFISFYAYVGIFFSFFWEGGGVFNNLICLFLGLLFSCLLNHFNFLILHIAHRWFWSRYVLCWPSCYSLLGYMEMGNLNGHPGKIVFLALSCLSWWILMRLWSPYQVKSESKKVQSSKLCPNINTCQIETNKRKGGNLQSSLHSAVSFANKFPHLNSKS